MMKHAEPTFDMAGGGGGGNSEKIKLIVAIVALVAAGIALAWHFGLIGGGKPKPLPGPVTQEEQQIQDESERISREALEKAKKDPNVTIGGA